MKLYGDAGLRQLLEANTVSAGPASAAPTMRRRRLGADLRQLREQNSLRLEEVADHLGVAPSTLSRIETGKAPTRTSYLAVMLDLYGVADPDRRRLLMDLAREGQRTGWWVAYDDMLPAGTGTYLGLEAEASALLAFQEQVVPGLVRTADYARALIAARRPELAADQVERLVTVQMRRQHALRGENPIRLRLILDEAVLLRSIGSPAVMREQLAQLIAAGRLPTVNIQVARLAGPPRRVLAPSFCVLSFAEPGDGDVACSAGLRGQVLLEQRPAEVRAMRRTFDALSRTALPPRASAELIGDLANRA
jgi:transcriptional regulator with XRE-family HTH domain